ncbi:type II secretion system protein [Candidatus Parcubacteria bacterium]|nr:type II secretion system protein [Candidatus Parcubacteria bacterium]
MKGFTLLEVILAITILTIAVSGAFILIIQVISASAAVQSKLIAFELAQEGIEIVKNIRDTNWLEQTTIPGISWDDGLDAGSWEADYISEDLSRSFGSGTYLYIDAHGFYSYFPSANQTKFKRKITISKEVEQPERLKVSVEVFWDDKGKIHQHIIVQTYLYNWRPQ